MTDDRRTACAVVGLTAIAAVLRAIRLDGGLWVDEIVTLVEFARPPLGEILTSFPHNNNHPLYSLLAHPFIVLFGEHPWSLRLPAYLFGVGAVPMLYLLGTVLTTKREALWSSAFLAVSYHHVWFSQNARGYTALVFLTMLATLLLIRGLEHNGIGAWIGYAGVAALGVYTHLTMVFVVAAHTLICLWLAVFGGDDKRSPSFRTWSLGFGLATLLGAALYAPMAEEVIAFYTAPALPAANVATAGWAVREAILGLLLGMTGLGLLIAAAVSFSGVVSYFRQSRLVLALLVLPGVLTAATVVALSQPIRPRFFFLFIGFGILIIVRGAMVSARWVVERWFRGAVPTGFDLKAGDVLVGLMIVGSTLSLGAAYRYPKQDFEGAMLFVESERAAGEMIVTAGAAGYPYERLYERDWESIESLGEYRELRAQTSRLWLLYTLADYLEAQTPDLMRAIWDECVPVRTFRGTVAGGDVVVCAAPAPDSSGGSP